MFYKLHVNPQRINPEFNYLKTKRDKTMYNEEKNAVFFIKTICFIFK